MGAGVCCRLDVGKRDRRIKAVVVNLAGLLSTVELELLDATFAPDFGVGDVKAFFKWIFSPAELFATNGSAGHDLVGDAGNPRVLIANRNRREDRIDLEGTFGSHV